MLAVASLALIRSPTHFRSPAQILRERIRINIVCNAANDSTPELDWDSAWRRWQLEGAGDDGAPPDSSSTAVQDALSTLLSAEAAVRAAKQDREAAADEKAALQAELAELQEARRLPYEIEEIEEIYRLLTNLDRSTAWKIAGRVVFAVVFVSLLLRWRTDGLQSVAGCLLLPLACATGQV